jgi:hypothetical protein
LGRNSHQLVEHLKALVIGVYTSIELK